MIEIRDLNGHLLLEIDAQSLQKYDFRRKKLKQAVFRGHNLTGADFTEADIERAIFDDGIITDGIFVDAYAPSASFRKVIAHRTDFRGKKLTNLESAKFDYADITGAKINKQTRTYKLTAPGAKGNFHYENS